MAFLYRPSRYTDYTISTCYSNVTAVTDRQTHMRKLTDAFLQLFVAKVPQNLTQPVPDLEVMIPVIQELRPFSSLRNTRCLVRDVQSVFSGSVSQAKDTCRSIKWLTGYFRHDKSISRQQTHIAIFCYLTTLVIKYEEYIALNMKMGNGKVGRIEN